MRTLGAALLIVGAAVGEGIATQQAQEPAAPNPIVGPPIVPLEESYLRWPIPASAAAYGRTDGNRLKPYIEQLAAISRKSRDAGNQWWGRITGTPAHAEAQQLVAAKLRSFGMDVRLEENRAPADLVPHLVGGERRKRDEGRGARDRSPRAPIDRYAGGRARPRRRLRRARHAGRLQRT